MAIIGSSHEDVGRSGALSGSQLRCTRARDKPTRLLRGRFANIQFVGGAPNGIEEVQAVCSSRLRGFTLHQIGEVLLQES